MNPSNLAFLQAMMTSIPVQAQPPLQAVGGHTMPQQAAFPTFFLQAPQLPTVPGPLSVPQFGGQPWVVPTLQTVHATSPSGFQSASAAPNTAGVPKFSLQNAVRAKSIPVGSAPDDERILINALRKAQAEGLTPLQGFGKLDKVNNHSTAAWKDYFLLHVERLGPKVYPQGCTKVPGPSTSRQSLSDSTSTSGGPEERMRDEGTSASSRSKRGPPVEEYHDDVYIPFLPPGIKPKAPRRDPRDNSHRFTKEEKIFFIHFLKYRLRRGPVPSQEQLYRELAERAPQHNADSWKRHWDKACKLPNEIYIQARKRVQSNLPTGSNLAESSDEGDHSGDEEEEGETDPEYEPPASRTPSSTVKKAKKGPRVRKYRVTEVDIQAMAHYIVEKRKCDGWRDLTGRLQWEEFAARPENKKRSLSAWHQISTRRPQDIDAYVLEYEAEQIPLAEENGSEPPMAEGSGDSQSKGRSMKGTAKRPLEGEEEPASGVSTSSTEKRPKLDKPTEIVVSD
ncbi:hypothetical protein V8D89_005886 [Ganoderma adspersum]